MKYFAQRIPGEKETYHSVNKLEELLIAAAQNQADRPLFYDELLRSVLVAIGETTTEGHAQFLTERIDEKTFCFAFTSEKAFEFSTTSQEKGLPRFEIACAELFKALTNADLGLLLNSGLSFGRAFTPGEVRTVLRDESVHIRKHVLASDIKLYVGVPKHLPTVLLTAFRSHIQECDDLADIYFGQMYIQKETLYLAVIELADQCSDERVAEVIESLSTIISEIGPGKPVDLVVADQHYRKIYDAGSLISCAAWTSP